MTWPLTPGAYLKYRRQADRLSIEDVAGKVFTDPALSLRDRIEWLELIEADAVPAGADTLAALHKVIRYDRSVLGVLELIARGERTAAHLPPLCRICACSWCVPCMSNGRGCHWVEPDLCSSCACLPHPAAAAA